MFSSHSFGQCYVKLQGYSEASCWEVRGTLVSTGRENKHIFSTLRQKVLRLCKLLFYTNIPRGICSKGFWNKINTLHIYRYSYTHDFPFVGLPHENVCYQKKFRTLSNTQKQILGCGKFCVPDFFFFFVGKTRNSEMICLKILLPNLSAGRKAVSQRREYTFPLCLLCLGVYISNSMFLYVKCWQPLLWLCTPHLQTIWL